MKATKLRITSLKFISAVDAGAQGPISNVALVKRAPTGDEYSLTAKVAKLDESIGVVFGYAVASTVDGGASPHIDLQGDAVVGGDELIKIALAFAEAGAKSDVMHDCAPDGWCPFVMPLNAETKKAYKLAGDVEGIAIGMKPSTETFKRFQTGELAAFSIFGTGERTPLDEAKRAPTTIAKEAVLTSTDDGHAHTISLDDPARYWCDQLQTSYQNAAGADNGHSHAWVFDATTGAITVADDSGHSHTVTAAVPADVLALYAVRETQRDAQNLAEAAAPVVVADDPSDGICAPVTDEESSGKTINVVIAARAPANKSTRSPGASDGHITPEIIMANEQTDKTIADLTKRLERAERIAKMSGAQKVHFDTLKGDDAEAFLAKSNKDRDAEIAEIEKANEVVYTSKSTGRVFRKSDSRDLVDMAKQLDAQSEQLAKRDEAIEKADIRKQAVEVLGGMPGDDDTHDLIVRALRKSGATAEQIEKAFASLKGIVATSTIGKRAPGVGGSDAPTGSDPVSKRVVFDAKLAEFAKAAGKTKEQAFELFCNTTEGAELYQASRVIQA